MNPRTFHAETPLQQLMLEQALLLARQLERTADDAPDGQVLARVEALAVPAARRRDPSIAAVHRHLLERARHWGSL